MESVPTSLAAIFGLLVLLPGFVALLLQKCLVYEREEPAVVFIAKALVYSFMVYTAFSLLTLTRLSLTPFWWIVEKDAGDQVLKSVHLNALSALVLFALALFLGVLAGIVKGHGWHVWLLRRLGITYRPGSAGLWCDLIRDRYRKRGEGKTFCASVSLKDGRQVYGWPGRISDEYDQGPVLLLAEARWVVDDESEMQPRDVLLMGSEIEMVEFYLGNEEEDQ